MNSPGKIRGHHDLGKLVCRALLMLALVLQGYTSQVHRHDAAAAALSASATTGDKTDAPAQPLDSDGRDHRCFICHLAGHASNSVMPQGIALAVVSARLVSYRGVDDRLESRDAPSAYSSRAPPSLFASA